MILFKYIMSFIFFCMYAVELISNGATNDCILYLMFGLFFSLFGDLNRLEKKIERKNS